MNHWRGYYLSKQENYDALLANVCCLWCECWQYTHVYLTCIHTHYYNTHKMLLGQCPYFPGEPGPISILCRHLFCVNMECLFSCNLVPFHSGWVGNLFLCIFNQLIHYNSGDILIQAGHWAWAKWLPVVVAKRHSFSCLGISWEICGVSCNIGGYQNRLLWHQLFQRWITTS